MPARSTDIHPGGGWLAAASEHGVDKIVQQAVGTVLEAIYEEDFVGFSYGISCGSRSPPCYLNALEKASTPLRSTAMLDEVSPLASRDRP
jgi:hypothetical protein